MSAATGCIHWYFKTAAAVRGAPSIGVIQAATGPRYAAFVGDRTANLYALDALTGELLWQTEPVWSSPTIDPLVGGGMFALELGTGAFAWHTLPADCGLRPRCSPAQLAAVSAIDGIAFSGSVDGHLRGYSTSDGTVVWDFDSVGTYEAVGGLTGRGGSMDGPGAWACYCGRHADR